DKQLRVLRQASEPGSVAHPPRGPHDVLGAGSSQKGASVERQEALGTRKIEDVVAQGTRTTVTIPAGTIGNERPMESVPERWFPPALQIVVLSRRTDPRFGETTYRVTKIKLAEPPAALFEPPAP